MLLHNRFSHQVWHALRLALLALLATTGSAALLAGCSHKVKPTTQGQARARRAGEESNQEKNGMSEEKNANKSPFYAALEKALARRGTKTDAICDVKEPVSRRILEEYGAMFLASERVLPPPVCIFKSDEEVAQFQSKAGVSSATIAETYIELQPAAMQALLKAREEAQAEGLDITPRGGTEAARRNFADTRRLWDTRFLPALKYWQEQGRLTEEQVARLKALPLHEQVKEVLELEKDGIFFSQDLSKSILYSIAAPGTSQHIAMLALDVEQFQDERVRQILARNGWFQTVKSDLPHFTFLDQKEASLPSLGLRAVLSDDRFFWIPNVND
jgi:hypothetical protein